MMHHSIYRIIWGVLALMIAAQAIFVPVFFSLILFLALVGFIWQVQRAVSKKWITVIKSLFMLSALIAIYLNYRTFLGVDAGVAFLTACLFAKALETRHHRDAIVLFNFALFVSASLFLYSQALAMAMLILVILIGCFLGLYRLQITQFEHDLHQRHILKHDLNKG